MSSAGQRDERSSEGERPKRTVFARDLEGVRLEKLRTLKASRAGYRGAMNRTQKSIEELLMDSANYEAVVAERNSFNKMFTNYTNCCREYEASLSHNEKAEQSAIREEYNSVSRNREELDRRLEEWIIVVQERTNIDSVGNFPQVKLSTSRLKEKGSSIVSPEFALTNTQADINLGSKIIRRTNSQSSLSHISQSDQTRVIKKTKESLKGIGDLTISSKASVKSDEARIRRAKAELQKKQRLELQEIERQQQTVEQQLEMARIKQEVELKRAELQRKRELVRLQNEIEQAKLEEEVEKLSEEELDGSNIMNDLTDIYNVNFLKSRGASKEELQLPPTPLQAEVSVPSTSRHVVPTLKEREAVHGQGPFRGFPGRGLQPHETTMGNWRTARRGETAGDSRLINEPTVRVDEPGESRQLQEVLQRQQESLIMMAKTLGSSISKGFEMPKRDYLTFDGNPMNYPRFMENFRTNIEEREHDPKARLTFLIQFCTGVAKEAISNCVMLPDPEGFTRAKEILHNSFGQSHIITHAYINKVTKGSSIKDSESDKLLQLARDMENCEINLTQLGCESEINAQSNLEKIVARLPRYLQADWAKEAYALLEKGMIPTFKHLTGYITKKAKLANSAFGQLIGSKPQDDKYSKPRSRKGQGTSFSTHGTDERPRNEFNPVKCYYCNKSGHVLEKCYSFRNQSMDARKELIRKEKLCILCLGKGHFVKSCRKRDACLVAGCGQRHHSLLHPVPPASKRETTSEEAKKDSNKGDVDSLGENGVGHCAATGAGRPGVRLRIVPVKVRGVDKAQEIETYALLDDGSDVSLCDSSLAKRLGITGTPTTFSLTTINEEKKENHGEEVRLIVSSLNGDESVEITRAWTVNKLPVPKRCIPTTHDVSHWHHLNRIEFPELKNQTVTMIIGSDVPEAHWVLDQRRGRRKEPYAVKTLLGWTLMGPVGTETDHDFQVHFIKHEDNNLQSQVERMFRMDFNESDASSAAEMSLEDQRALSIMENSAKKVDGHYQIALPWRYNTPCLPNNRKMAEKRLVSLQWRLKKNPWLRDKYRNIIVDYVEKGYAGKVPEEKQTRPSSDGQTATGRIWYLPHHPVFHPQKPGKVRIVFDCAAKYRNTSLNDQLFQGPDLTNKLIGVLLRFRQDPIALTSDVEAMFHQVRVNPQDSNALRFLWWPDADFSQPPEDYQMRVHLFGATSSPSCASFGLRKTAQDHETEFDKETINTVNKNFYVDDCLKSVQTVSKAVRLASQLRALLAKGGFHLTKWVSNNRDVLASIPQSERAPSMVDLDFESLPVERALGVMWDVEADIFRFRIVERKKVNTRRGILSLVSSMYDPFGFAAPFVLPAKQVLQRLCQVNYEWDEVVPTEELEAWYSWQESLTQLTTVAIPRCFRQHLSAKLRSVQLHNFSDASGHGYGAASYLRLVDEKGKVNVSLLVGKSRVTPLKPVTIPRLELTAAVLAVKLNRQVQEELEIPIQCVIFWTDSTIVLQYINNESKRFQTFVANRLAVIHELSKPSQWRHVGTKSNPADHASRGIKPDEQRKIHEWLNGPRFLWEHENRWPTNPEGLKEMPDEHLEWRKTVQVHRISLVKQSPAFNKFLEYYSSWYALQKGVAWLVRFVAFLHYVQSKESHGNVTADITKGPLTVKEIRIATEKIVKYVQRQCFAEEIKILETATTRSQKSSNHPLRNPLRRSKLRKLSPILVNGIMRVGGRLERSPISFSAKHPMILPQEHHITELIIRHYHQHEGHTGTRQVLAAIRHSFWILHGPSEVRKLTRKCMDCQKRHARPGEQIMASLPDVRVTPSNPPFTFVGVDYFGPIMVRQGRSQVKRYGCLFTCLTMRAVHIEIAHSLDAESFLCAFSRFTSRRGQPRDVYSDNGTNFTAANSTLKEEFEKLQAKTSQTRIQDRLRKNYIQWHFNPPAASHMGGVWERLIRSIRRILKALLQEQVVNDEALLTFMAEVERILNDRPLVHQENHPDDLDPLTPSKLLLLRSDQRLPLGVLVNVDKYNKRWRQAQELANAFWKRWIKEYLPLLQERQKWTTEKRSLRINDLVLVVDERIPRGQWPLGVIEEVYPDRHGVVRQVLVRTTKTRLRRDTRKLCFLEGAC